MASTDPAGDETCPERRRAEMPIAFTPPSPFARATDIVTPPNHTSGRKAILISSRFGSRTCPARDLLNISSANRTQQPKPSKILKILDCSTLRWLR